MNFESLNYCGQIVREHDPDRFFLSMFVPAARREDVWALMAFNHEIAKTRAVVSETQLGLIRLQWWREQIMNIYAGGSVPEHEVLKPLAAAIGAHGLAQDLFETLIYAREFDLEDVAPSTLEGLLHYADLTSTPLMRLILKVMGEDERSEPVSVVGVNYALAGLLRSILAFAGQRRCLLPDDLMQAYGVRTGLLYDPPSPKRSGGTGFKAQEGLKQVVQAVAGAFVGGVACEARFLKASQKMAALYIGQLQGVKFDIFDPRLRSSPAFKELRVVLNL